MKQILLILAAGLIGTGLFSQEAEYTTEVKITYRGKGQKIVKILRDVADDSYDSHWQSPGHYASDPGAEFEVEVTGSKICTLSWPDYAKAKKEVEFLAEGHPDFLGVENHGDGWIYGTSGSTWSALLRTANYTHGPGKPFSAPRLSSFSFKITDKPAINITSSTEEYINLGIPFQYDMEIEGNEIDATDFLFNGLPSWLTVTDFPNENGVNRRIEGTLDDATDLPAANAEGRYKWEVEMVARDKTEEYRYDNKTLTLEVAGVAPSIHDGDGIFKVPLRDGVVTIEVTGIKPIDGTVTLGLGDTPDNFDGALSFIANDNKYFFILNIDFLSEQKLAEYNAAFEAHEAGVGDIDDIVNGGGENYKWIYSVNVNLKAENLFGTDEANIIITAGSYPPGTWGDGDDDDDGEDDDGDNGNGNGGGTYPPNPWNPDDPDIWDGDDGDNGDGGDGGNDGNDGNDGDDGDDGGTVWGGGGGGSGGTTVNSGDSNTNDTFSSNYDISKLAESGNAANSNLNGKKNSRAGYLGEASEINGNGKTQDKNNRRVLRRNNKEGVKVQMRKARLEYFLRAKE